MCERCCCRTSSWPLAPFTQWSVTNPYEKNPKPSIHPYDFFPKRKTLRHFFHEVVEVASPVATSGPSGRPLPRSPRMDLFLLRNNHSSFCEKVTDEHEMMILCNDMIWRSCICDHIFRRCFNKIHIGFWNAMFILARWRAPSDRWSGHRQRQRHPRDLVGIKRDYVTWRREIVEPDLTSWFRGIVALTLNKCKPRSLSQIETHRRSILFTGQWLQTSFWHVPRQQARLLRRLHWVLPRKDAKGTCQMLLDGTDIISVSPPSLKKKVYVEAGSGYYKLLPNFLWNLIRILQKVGW